jgi:hypothetical protein
VHNRHNSFIELKVRRISKLPFCKTLLNTRGVELSNTTRIPSSINAEKHHALAKEQYGSHKRHWAIDLALNKVLTNDLIRQAK